MIDLWEEGRIIGRVSKGMKAMEDEPRYASE
jgi:hypothetical protein